MKISDTDPRTPNPGGAVMTAPTPATALVEDYLQRLRAATAGLPQGPRAELLDHITAHLAETVAPDADIVRARQVLDELGTPEEIASSARFEAGTAPVTGHEEPGRVDSDRSTRTTYDVLTLLTLLLGGFVVPLLGWVAGVVMLWGGPRWSTADKLLGTLAWPVAVTAAAVSLLVLGGTGFFLMLGVAVVVLVGFIAVFVHLLRAADRALR